MEKLIPWSILVTLALPAPSRAAGSDAGTASAPAGMSTATTDTSPSRGPRYRASFTYLTSRAAGHDFRSFKSSATDDSGATTEGSSLPNLNYLSTRLSISPWAKHTFSVGALQSLDSDSTRTITGPSGDGGHTLPSTIFSLRYGYRLSQNWSLSAGQTYVTGRKFSDPTTGINYRNKNQEDQGWGDRVGLSLSVPTTERSHNDQLITRATIRSAISYTAGRWTSSAGLAYSRPFFKNPGNLSASNFPTVATASGQVATRPHHGGGGGSHTPGQPHNSTPGGSNGDAAANAINDPNASTLEAVDIATSEREADRTTGSIGMSFQPANGWKLGTGAGVTYLETWRQKAIWLTSAKVITAAYSFWKMEAGSDVQLYSDIHKYAHPALPSLMSVGVHLSYYIGADRQTQL